MKMHSMLARGLLVSAFLSAASSIHAAPRNPPATPAQHLILRVNWGGSDGGDREDTMEIIGWSHEIVSPRDATSGLPSGKRQHKPFTVSKVLDKATPLFVEAYVANKLIPAAELVLVQTDGNGNEVPTFSIRLNRALVVSYQSSGDASRGDVAVESLSLVYESIEWNSVSGGTMATDSWSSGEG